MTDLQTKLRWLSERGVPVGAEELIERIEAELAGDPLVVVEKRREGPTMTKTQHPPTTKQPNRNRGPAWAVAAFVVIVAVAGLYFAFSGDSNEGEVAATPPPPTTAAPDVETTTGLETIRAAVAAYYSGDGEGAAELFDLSDRSDDQIRQDSAYQAAIGGRLTLNCTGGEGGVFTCRVPYHNAITDAIGFVDQGDTNRVVVEDGVITEFGFPEHSWIVLSMGAFLALEDRFEGYGPCGFGPFPESCATIQMENLDDWVEWRQTPLDPASLVEVTMESWYGRDCEQARFLSAVEVFDDGGGTCPFGADQPVDNPIRMMEYEYILGADVSVDRCEEVTSTVVSCDVSYSNKLNLSVDEPPAVTTRDFTIQIDALVTGPAGELAWYRYDYPEDAELRDSFQRYAEETELEADFSGAGCATNRTEICAQLIEDNLEPWAAWYKANGQEANG